MLTIKKVEKMYQDFFVNYKNIKLDNSYALTRDNNILIEQFESLDDAYNKLCSYKMHINDIYNRMIYRMKASKYIYDDIEYYISIECDPAIDSIIENDADGYNIITYMMQEQQYKFDEVKSYILNEIKYYMDKVHNLRELDQMADYEGLEELMDYKYVLFNNIFYDNENDQHRCIFSYKVRETQYLNIEIVILNMEDFNGHEKNIEDIEDIKIKIVDIAIN